MRNRIFGGIGVVWGGFALLNSFSRGAVPVANGAFGTGQRIGMGLGALMFAAGFYYLVKGDGSVAAKKKNKKPKNPIRTPI